MEIYSFSRLESTKIIGVVVNVTFLLLLYSKHINGHHDVGPLPTYLSLNTNVTWTMAG